MEAGMDLEQPILLALWYVVFLLSITCHEAAHAWMAWRGGDPTAYLGGQVSLSPIPHVRRELFGTVIFPLLSFLQMGWMMGWASAPYDPRWEDRHPKRAALMAAAGPGANLVLALIAFLVLKAGLVGGIWVEGAWKIDDLVIAVGDDAGLASGLGRFCSIMLSLNLVLLLFNLLPFPPMDGASILAGLFEPARNLRDRLRATPLAGLIGLLVAWYLFRHIFPPIYAPVLRLLFAGTTPATLD